MTTHQQIFVNLPVKDLPRSRAFFEALGYGFNPEFSNSEGACCVISEHIYAMLLTEPFFKGFTKKPIAFFKSLGYSFNPQFTDETATCMIIADDIYAMLLTHAKFAEFSPKPICDATKSVEVLIALSCESRAQVDELVARAIAAGGSAHNPKQDHGFMYSHGFEDLDGHVWELVYMVPGATPNA
jgi:predicted lactoylglutathione lyase